MQAFRTSSAVRLGRAPPKTETLCLPCGECIGCLTAKAKEWALRCHLELLHHDATTFLTITYDERWVPPTLDKMALRKYLKRIRFQFSKLEPARSIRFFASGEYGEQNGRPHYHAIIFGADSHFSQQHTELMQSAWKYGHIDFAPATPARIAYVAGYTSKKLDDKFNRKARGEMIDPSSGEVYTYEPPFIAMSKRPGIGGDARQYASSWRSYAIHNGAKIPVPRFYHEAWKKLASPDEIERLAQEKKEQQQKRTITLQMLAANEKINESRQAIKAAKRLL